MRKEDPVTLSGPTGQFVFDLESRAPVIFIAWDDAFAPVKSLIQHAMSLEISENMYLYWVAATTGHYRDNLCRSWADAYDNFFYTPLPGADGLAANIERILASHADLPACEVYAAGPEVFLEPLKAAALARGLPLGKWHAQLMV